MKKDELVMFSGQLCDKEMLELLIRELAPAVCEVVKQRLIAGHGDEAVNRAALSCVNAVTKALAVKSLVSPTS